MRETSRPDQSAVGCSLVVRSRSALNILTTANQTDPHHALFPTIRNIPIDRPDQPELATQFSQLYNNCGYKLTRDVITTSFTDSSD